MQYAAGQYYIQDAASMLALTLCDLQPGQLVCDLCAAPGGKATGLLDQLQGQGLLLANEVIHSRMPMLQTALCRSGWDNFATSQLDAEQLSQLLPGQFDCVLVDAPCSGQSMVGRDKQSLAAFSKDQVELNAARQRRIIRAAAKLVRPGGRLIYSTCTFAVAENEQIVEDFLEQMLGWKLAPRAHLQAWQSARLPGTYRLWPHRDQCDGGFAAALQNNGQSDMDAEPTSMVRRASKQRLETELSLDELAEFLSLGDDRQNAVPSANERYRRLRFGDQLHLLKSSSLSGIENALCGAVPIAQLFASRIEPLYGSSVVRLQGLQVRNQAELNNQQAMAFVRGESVNCSNAKTPNGWCQANWNSCPIAWGKKTNNTIKNHLPKVLRNSSVTLW